MVRDRASGPGGPVRLPWGLLGMIALVVAIERAEAGHFLDLSSRDALNWKYKGGQVKFLAPRTEILCFGDSQVNFGVSPRVLKEQTGKRASNLAAFMGPAPASYFLLRRALRSGVRPGVILVDFAAMFLENSPGSQVRPYPWAELLDLRESLELAREARDADLFARIVMARLLPSFQDRYQIREDLGKALRGEPITRRQLNTYFWQEWSANGGANCRWKALTPVGLAPPARSPRLAPWRSDPVNALYLRRFLALAARQGIPVLWLLPPIHPEWQALAEWNGEDASYAEFVRAEQARNPDVLVVDGRHAGYPPPAFFDAYHLELDGAAAFSIAIAEVVRRSLAEGASAPRWIELPEYQRSVMIARGSDPRSR